jgi:hypothetical protein
MKPSFLHEHHDISIATQHWTADLALLSRAMEYFLLNVLCIYWARVDGRFH